MPPQPRRSTLASVSLITLAMLLSTMPPASAQDTPTATPPAPQPELAAPAQPPAVDIARQRVAELEAELARRTQELAQRRGELDRLGSDLQQLTGERTTLQQQLAEASRARDASGQDVAAREQQLATLEQELAAVQQGMAERAAENERLAADLRELAEARDRLEAYAVERTKLLEQAGREVRVGADRVEALERGLGSARQQAEERQSEVERANRLVAELESARAGLEQQLAAMTQARDQAAGELAARDQRIAALQASLVTPVAGSKRGVDDQPRAEPGKTATKARPKAAVRSSRSVDGPRAPCRPLALRFDETFSEAIASGIAGERLSRASELRNQGMETCNAGLSRRGQQQLRRAIAALGG